MSGAADLAVDLFSALGPIRIRRLFGGAGIYLDDRMFGHIADEIIHIKVDDAMKVELAELGSGPFEYVARRKSVAGAKIDLGYWRLPDGALDDPEEAADWGRRALVVAQAKAKPPRKKAAKR